MKKTITAIITAALCLPLLSGCGKWLDVKPYDEIAEDDLLSTQDGFMRRSTAYISSSTTTCCTVAR